MRPLVAFFPLVLLACSGGQQKQPDLGPSQKNSTTVSQAVDTKVTSFTVAPENLKVDAVGMNRGSISPDGARDHVFTATIEGPVDALFIAECDEKGNPVYGFRASTVARNDELPKELGGVIDIGAMTIGIGVVEDKHFVNTDLGGLNLAATHHAVTLYAPNTAALQPGDYVRLWARSPSGGLAVSPVARY
jgi:hypothetical protein